MTWEAGHPHAEEESMSPGRGKQERARAHEDGESATERKRGGEDERKGGREEARKRERTRGREDKRTRARRGPEASKRGRQGPEEERKTARLRTRAGGRQTINIASKQEHMQADARVNGGSYATTCDCGREAVLINSATGTRTRVARARAEYPSQLDYSGC